MEVLRVRYRLSVDPAAAEARAEAIAREQTVEVPRVAVRDAFIEREILGRVESVSPAEAAGDVVPAERAGGVASADGASLATIAYPLTALTGDPAQFLGVLFGNTSLHRDVECVDFDAPASLLAAFAGPRFGQDVWRECTGVRDRALTCTAVKPLGHTPKALAEMLRTFARAGIDVVKDDQGLADHAFCPFEERVRACLAAADEMTDALGKRVLYVPNLLGTPERVLEQLRFAEAHGARAVMVAPMLIGLPFFQELCQRHASVPVMAHPSLGGAARFAPELLFGKLLRAFGADAVIFVGHAGRFGVPRETCAAIVRNLRAPWAGLRPSLPVPGGGIEVDTVAEALSFYGRDAMLLVGGSLHVEEGALLERSRAFVSAVAAVDQAAVDGPPSRAPEETT
jgi:ribulose-bisphosphate carboxylase large chain